MAVSVPNAKERRPHGRGAGEQLKDAIIVQPRYRDALQGVSVILIDDILTIGATAEACAKALIENGCHSVDILVAARVIPS